MIGFGRRQAGIGGIVVPPVAVRCGVEVRSHQTTGEPVVVARAQLVACPTPRKLGIAPAPTALRQASTALTIGAVVRRTCILCEQAPGHCVA